MIIIEDQATEKKKKKKTNMYIYHPEARQSHKSKAALITHIANSTFFFSLS